MKGMAVVIPAASRKAPAMAETFIAMVWYSYRQTEGREETMNGRTDGEVKRVWLDDWIYGRMETGWVSMSRRLGRPRVYM